MAGIETPPPAAIADINKAIGARDGSNRLLGLAIAAAVITPPALTVLLSMSLNSTAIAHSGAAAPAAGAEMIGAVATATTTRTMTAIAIAIEGREEQSSNRLIRRYSGHQSVTIPNFIAAGGEFTRLQQSGVVVRG
jgi:hypothetical protein